MLTIKPDSEKITFYFFKCIDLVKFHVNLKLLPKLISKYIKNAFRVMLDTKNYFIRKVALFLMIFNFLIKISLEKHLLPNIGYWISLYFTELPNYNISKAFLLENLNFQNDFNCLIWW